MKYKPFFPLGKIKLHLFHPNNSSFYSFCILQDHFNTELYWEIILKISSLNAVPPSHYFLLFNAKIKIILVEISARGRNIPMKIYAKVFSRTIKPFLQMWKVIVVFYKLWNTRFTSYWNSNSLKKEKKSSLLNYKQRICFYIDFDIH